MSSKKPSVPKGTRDFLPSEMLRRNYIFNMIREVFGKYGFLPLETPAMENLSTLLGKYGDEGDKLLYRILNSGDFLKNVSEDILHDKNSTELSSLICDRGLRYDLTVPFARFVVQHRSEIQFPFKRYQIQPVWRADRPQKGRYREFYQCDADVIGSNSLLNEAELLSIIDDVFNLLNINVVIKLNNRKVLAGLAGILGAENKLADLTIAIDKIDKIGRENVLQELKKNGFGEQELSEIEPFLDFKGNFGEKIEFLSKKLQSDEIGREGINEIIELFEYIENKKLQSEIDFDISLARGLNYYTGAIIEVKAKDMEIGSICGGGRYDDLTGIFGMPDVSGVGISFGADRIYDVMQNLKLFPEKSGNLVQLMFVNFGKVEEKYILPLLSKVRKAGVNAEIFPDQAKLKKQMNYANNNHIPYVALIGENEIQNELITLKDMSTGEQLSVTPDAMISKLTNYHI